MNPDDEPVDDSTSTETEGILDEPPETQADEVYCTSCGEPIKEQAAVCPDCGVPQTLEDEVDGMSDQQLSAAGIPPERAYDLRKLAQKNTGFVGIVSFFISPLGYLMVGKWGWALLNFFTLNYLFMGIFLVPLHTWWMINGARKELDEAGVAW